VIPRPKAEYALVDIARIVSVKERESARQGQGNGTTKDKKDTADQAGHSAGKQPGDSPGTNKGGNAPTSDADKGNRGNAGQSERQGESPDGAGPKNQGGQAAPQQSPPSLVPDQAAELPPKIFQLLKWFIGGIVALVIGFLLLRAAVRFLANFTHWASRLLQSCQSFWDRLIGWWHGRLPEAVLDAKESTAPPLPFSSFPNPFLTGDVQRMSAAALVRQTFNALEAWGCERGVQRQPGETPLEFVGRLAADFPAVEKATLDLADLYAGLAYSRHEPPQERLKALRDFWLLLGQLEDRPVSAV
jgi:Domain of unknown function (DUF4129)